MIKNSLYSILKTLSMLLFPLMTISYASRVLEPDGMGQINFANSMINIMIMFASLGVSNYGVRECAAVRDDKVKLSKTVKELLTINLIMTAVIYMILFLMLILIDDLKSRTQVILIYSCLIMFTILGMEWLFNAIEDFKYIALRVFAIQVISFLLVILFVKNEGDVWKYAVIHVFSVGGGYLVSFIYSRKFIDYKTKCRLELKKHIKPMLNLFITAAFVNIYVSLDSVMLGFMTSDESIGLYSTAYKISSILCAIITAALVAVVPRISYYAERGMINEYKILLKKAMEFTLMLSIPITFGALMFGDYLVVILGGSEFKSAALSSEILSFRLMAGSINSLLVYNLFIPLKKDKYAIIVTAAAAATDIILNIFLIPEFKHVGTAISTVAAELVLFIIGMILSRKLIDFSEPFKKIWQYIIAAIPIIPICYFLSLAGMNDIIYVLISTVISAAVYFIILIAMKNTLVFEFLDKVKSKLAAYKK